LYEAVRSRFLAALLGASVLLAACGSGGGSRASSTTRPLELAAETASFDLAVGPPTRYLIGVFTSDKQGLVYGSVDVRFCFLGATKATGPCQLGEPHVAAFLPTPGTDVPAGTTAPQVVPPAKAKGVYSTDAGFDRAGYWRAQVTADVNGARLGTTTDFQVLERHALAAVGDAALPSENLTVNTQGAPPAAIDSRAAAGGLVPDPELHQTTIGAALAAHRPTVVVFSSPVYCISRFCGPITDMVGGLAKTYGDRASFVHVEIWQDYSKQIGNKAATDWLYRNDTVTEPWVFLVGADGKIAARWDNVVTQAEIEPLLQKLPVIGRG
jgi:hypothetical protein